MLRDYFNGEGFDRWRTIYGAGEVTGVRRSVREGHTLMLQTLLGWLDARPLPDKPTALDAGCGTGLLTVELAQRGYHLTAADIAPQMVQATRRAAMQAAVQSRVNLLVSDIEGIPGEYDVVACLDVLIHYPQPSFAQLARHLTLRSRHLLYLTYAPHNPALAMLHHIGGMFPRSQRRTDIQMVPESFVRGTLADAGFTVTQHTRISRGFYHIALLEAERTAPPARPA